MDDITSAISKILEDPESVSALKSVAGSLLKKEETPKTENSNAPDMAKLMKIVGALKNGTEDDRTRLLMSLKPYVSVKRKQKIDEAVKILRLVSILPLVSEYGLL